MKVYPRFERLLKRAHMVWYTFLAALAAFEVGLMVGLAA